MSLYSSKRPLKIWIVSLYESTPVDNTRPMRFAGISDAAVKRGHHVTHFSCTFRHSTKQQRFDNNRLIEISPNFDLVFIYADTYHNNYSWKRIVSHQMFTRNFMRFISELERPDVVFVTMPPISSGLALTRWGKRNKVPIVLDIIDPWPDVFLRLAPKAFRGILKVLLAPVYRQLKTILGNVAAVTSISEEYVEWAKSFGFNFGFTGVFYPAIKFEEVQAVLTPVRKSRKFRKSGKLTIIYAGNLASSYDIPTILKAAEIVEGLFPGKTEFVICGVGPQVAIIEEHMRRHKNVRYLGRIGQKQLLEQYSVSDLGLTQHVNGATQSITYKFFDYLGAGLPILNSLQSEMAFLISQNRLGLNNKPGDAQELVRNIVFFMNHPDQLISYKENAIDFTKQFGDANIVYDNLVGLLERVVEGHETALVENVQESF